MRGSPSRLVQDIMGGLDSGELVVQGKELSVGKQQEARGLVQDPPPAGFVIWLRDAVLSVSQLQIMALALDVLSEAPLG